MVSRKDEFINLKDVFGLKVDCVLYPGEFSVIMGDTGVNKTSIVQNIMLATTWSTNDSTTQKNLSSIMVRSSRRVLCS